MYWLGFLLFQELLSYNLLLASLQCLDDSGNSVEWAYAIKLPILQSETGYLRTGTGYISITPKSGSDWALSEKSLADKDSFLGRTLSPLYSAEEAKNLLYLAYNDDPPNVHATLAYAHAKGIVITDGKTGIWLVHSAPRFPELPKFTPDSEQESAEIDPVEYTFPPTASKFGQSFLCLSLSSTQMETVGLQLEYMRPKVYASNVPEFLATKFPTLKSVIDGTYVKTEPYFHTAPLKTVGGSQFLSFAKTAKFGKDLYSEYVAQELKAPLEVETWSNGPGPLPSDYSNKNQQVVNVKELDFEVSGHKLEYWNSKDHSKWAVTSLASNNYICVGDINRMESQFKRGGGTICSQNDLVSGLFSKGIEIMDSFDLTPSTKKVPKNPSSSKGSEDEGTSEDSTKPKKGGRKKSSQDNSPDESSDDVTTTAPKKSKSKSKTPQPSDSDNEGSQDDGTSEDSTKPKKGGRKKRTTKQNSPDESSDDVTTTAPKKSKSKTTKPSDSGNEGSEDDGTSEDSTKPKKGGRKKSSQDNSPGESSDDVTTTAPKKSKSKSKTTKPSDSDNEGSEEDTTTRSTKKKSTKTKSKKTKGKGSQSDDSLE